MARAPIPRYGIAEWFGNDITTMTPDERQHFGQLAADQDQAGDIAGAVVNVDCRIGMGVIINTAASIDHDCVLEDAVHISPGARLAGGVCVGERSWVGIGASVKQLVEIGSGVTVGAGAVVVSNMPDDCVAVGVPARVR